MALEKAQTGISGFDEITGGGLPNGRPSLICGGAGSGKTLFGIEFLVRGALEYNEPGVLVSFEETSDELITNATSIGCNLADLVSGKKLILDEVLLEPNEIEETGAYDLEGLFIRLGYAIDSIGAKRVVLDTIEALFSIFSDEFTLRSELHRLFRWLKGKGVTAVITAERGQGALTRHGLEEYVSDCVILLDHRTAEQIATRRLRIVKYRGSAHGTNEYPFLIGNQGLSVLPITSMGLNHVATNDRIPSGVPRLDTMLGGQGYFRGSSILISGTAGSGKTSIACHFANATCRRGERCLYFAFEESQSQIIRDMRSIGLDLEQWLKPGTLQFSAVRPTTYGLEMHLVAMHRLISDFKPAVVIVDPVTNLTEIGNSLEVKAMLMRLIDDLKVKNITCMMISLTKDSDHLEKSEVNISSLIDTWFLLRDVETNGERNRLINAIKSRGMAHSNQVQEFLLTGHGIELVDTYVGTGRVLTGSGRLVQQLQEKAADQARHQEIESRERVRASRRQLLEAQIVALQTEIEIDAEEAKQLIAQEQMKTELMQLERQVLARSRKVDPEHTL
ncbi:MAG: circadian clock protein KaiC [Aggregatilineales bacterium]